MRAEAVCSVAVFLLLGGCLAAPPDTRAVDAGHHDALDGSPLVVDGGAPVDGCTEGSEPDLAYLNRVGLVGYGSSSRVALADFAMVVNPGPDRIETDSLGAAVRTADGIAASVVVTARDGQLALPPGQAHGAVAVDYAAQVLSDVDESWTDYAFPALAVDLSIAGRLDGNTDIALELDIGGYHVEAPITLVPGAAFDGEGLGADRITARCGQ